MLLRLQTPCNAWVPVVLNLSAMRKDRNIYCSRPTAPCYYHLGMESRHRCLPSVTTTYDTCLLFMAENVRHSVSLRLAYCGYTRWLTGIFLRRMSQSPKSLVRIKVVKPTQNAELLPSTLSFSYASRTSIAPIFCWGRPYTGIAHIPLGPSYTPAAHSFCCGTVHSLKFST